MRPDEAPARRPLTLLLVRHGQSEWNAEGRMQGQTAHVPLTELGHAQAAAAACSWPRAVSGTCGVWPCMRPAAFHSLCPCRTRSAVSGCAGMVPGA